MENIFERTELLYGKKAMEKLKNSRVAVFGIGGVGGYTTEALVRSGVGTIDLIDNDVVNPSNLNRQIIATTKTIGQYKVDAAKRRAMEINPDIKVNTYKTFYMPETSNQFDFTKYDYIVDAIDTVTGKIELVVNAHKANVPIISSMGAGNKIHPAGFEVADIYKTSVCPLARVMRRELKKRDIKKLKVVYSKEPPVTFADSINNDVNSSERGIDNNNNEASKFVKQVPGSNAFVPSVAGLIIAGEIINDLVQTCL